MFRSIRALVVLAGVAAAGYSFWMWRQPQISSPGVASAASSVVRPLRSSLSSSPGRSRNLTTLFSQTLQRVDGDAVSAPHFTAGAVYYSPWQNLEAIDSEAIAGSHCNHLDIAMYAFTDWKLAETVAAFARTSRPVRIYRDREQYEQEARRGSRVIEILHQPNIQIRVKQSRVLMHLKAWSDGCILREGSANWSPGGEKQQDNTLTFLNDSASVKNFEADFNAMWNRRNNIVVQ